jgi:tRNA-Thr(GGU) m(6)t(6)A37 methyltransferase TsaA
MSDWSVRPIGVVQSSLISRGAAPKQGAEGAPDAWVEFLPEFLAGVQGVAVGGEFFLLTLLHQASRDILQVHPRGNPATPLTGVFLTRSPDRPNPIGLHRVTVREVDLERRRIRVGPLEAIDGTPVLDLKPVLRGER